MMKYRTIVVDDEAPARARVLSVLQTDPELEIVAECSDGFSAISSIVDLSPDIVFLDIEMPELDGFGVLAEAGVEPAIVFCTAHQQYALKAFDIHAIDYVLKPYKRERLLEAVSLAKAKVRKNMQPETPARADLRRTLFPIKVDGKIVLLRFNEVEWIESERDYVRIAANRHTYLVRDTLTNVLSRLDPNRFIRIHRSTIVNLSFIAEIQPLAGAEHVALMRDGKQFVISRGYRSQLTQLLNLT